MHSATNDAAATTTNAWKQKQNKMKRKEEEEKRSELTVRSGACRLSDTTFAFLNDLPIHCGRVADRRPAYASRANRSLFSPFLSSSRSTTTAGRCIFVFERLRIIGEFIYIFRLVRPISLSLSLSLSPYETLLFAWNCFRFLAFCSLCVFALIRTQLHCSETEREGGKETDYKSTTAAVAAAAQRTSSAAHISRMRE